MNEKKRKEALEQDEDSTEDKSVGENGKCEIGLIEEISRFRVRIDGLATSVYFSMKMASEEHDKWREKRDDLLDKYGDKKVDEDEEEYFEIPAKHVKEVGWATRRIKHLSVAIDTLPKNHFIALISAYDYFLGRVLRWYYLKKPGALRGSERKISLREMLEFGSISAAKSYFVEKEVESLMRDNHADQIKSIENRIGCTLRKNLNIWPEFIEITERRNLFTHTDGSISEQYIRVCASHGVTLDENVNVGDVLWVPAKYFERAVDVIYEMGVSLGQTVGRVICPEEMVDLDGDLTNICVDLISDDRVILARDLLEFATRLPRHADEDSRLRTVINRAQCYKWLEKDKECLEQLDAEDWSASNRRFKLCVAVLKDDFESAAQFMIDLGPDAVIDEYDYVNWPIFKNFRDTDQFSEAFQKVFGKAPVDHVAQEGTKKVDPSDTNKAPNETTH